MLYRQSPLGCFYVQLKQSYHLLFGPVGRKARALLMGAFVLVSYAYTVAHAQTQGQAQYLSHANPRPGVYLVNRQEIIERVKYPAALRETLREGYVLVNIRISAQGKYLQHYVRQATHPQLAQAIAEPLLWVQFAPTDAGTPIEPGWVTVPFRFRLD